jgi:aminoglycoside/choline kinase family phosphotransferase
MDALTPRAQQIETFLASTKWAQSGRQLVAGDASNRRYDRLTRADRRTAILMDAPADKGEDVRPFIRIAKYLNDCGLSAPIVYAHDEANGLLIIEDLGDDLFATLMQDDPSVEVPLYQVAVDALIQLHEAAPLDLPLCDSVWFRTMNNLIFDWYANDIENLESEGLDFGLGHWVLGP